MGIGRVVLPLNLPGPGVVFSVLLGLLVLKHQKGRFKMELPRVSLDQSDTAILVIPAIGQMLPVSIPVVANEITGMGAKFYIQVQLVVEGLVGWCSMDNLLFSYYLDGIIGKMINFARSFIGRAQCIP